MKRYLLPSQIKNFLKYITITIFLSVQLASSASGELVDKVVAVVNDDIITLSELEAETTTLYQALAKDKSPEKLMEVMDEAREVALNKLIDRTLMEQKAKQFNLTVSEQEIDTAFERMRDNLSLSSLEFREQLKQSGLTEELYRTKLRDNILQSKILSIDVRSKIVITDEMMLEYFERHYTSRLNKGDFYLLQIGFSFDKDSSKKGTTTKEQALQRAKRIHKLAVDGQDFKTLAKKFSDLPSASDGGDIGVFTLDEMAPAMRDSVKDLQPGEISSIIELASGYQFFKLLSGENDDVVATSSFEANKDEIREKLFKAKMEEAYKAWVKELKQNAYIQKL